MGKVLIDKSEYVWRLTLSNEARRNAIDSAMMDELEKILNSLENHPEVRVLTIQGAGDRSFSSGADIHDWSTLSAIDMGRSWIRRGIQILDYIDNLDQVTIAVVNGNAFGGGLELVLSTDLCIAAQGATFAFPETSIGAIPGWYGIPRLVNAVGTAKAKKLALAGEVIDAETAESWGIVSAVTQQDNLMKLMDEYIDRIINKSPIAIAASKQLFKLSNCGSAAQGIHELAATACRYSADGNEGISAFTKKKPPNFSGR